LPLPFDHTFVAGDELASRDNAETLRQALNERADAATFGVVSMNPPQPGWSVADWWRDLQRGAYLLSTRFLRSYDGVTPSDDAAVAVLNTGVPDYDWSGLPAQDQSQVPYRHRYVFENEEASGFANETSWPPPSGFTRKFPREIWSTANSGAAGQVARFTARINTVWYGPRDGPDFERAVTTPLDQRDYSGRLFLHNGVAWVEHPGDPLPDGPDVVTDAGLIRPGDYIGAWIANGIRDALRRLRWVAPDGFTSGNYGGWAATGDYAHSFQLPGGFFDSTWTQTAAYNEHRTVVHAWYGNVGARSRYYTTTGIVDQPFGDPAPPGGASMAFHYSGELGTQTVNDSPSEGGPQSAGPLDGISSGGGVGFFGLEARPEARTTVLPARARRIDFVLLGVHPVQFPVGFETQNMRFDTFGITMPSGLAAALNQPRTGATLNISSGGGTFTGPVIGNRNVRPTLILLGESITHRGWRAQNFPVIRFDVPGGFAHY
jgi:hypothetical protein